MQVTTVPQVAKDLRFAAREEKCAKRAAESDAHSVSWPDAG